MSVPRPFSTFAVLLCCLMGGFAAVAQTAGSGGASPPMIQGPPGGPLALPPSQPGDAAGQEPLRFKMYAVMGQKKANANTTLDGDLKPLQDVFKNLPYTDYEKISIDERETPDGAETQFPINPVYSLVVKPNGADEQGAAKLDITVYLMQDNGKQIKALTAQATAKPGDALLLRGMPLNPGDLIIVLQRDPGKQDSQGGKSDQDKDQKDQQQKKDQSKDKDKDKDKQDKKDEDKKDAQKAEEKEAKPEQKDEDKKDQADKKDKGNLESILQSLENVDRKEQEEVHSKRDRIDFNGDWW